MNTNARLMADSQVSFQTQLTAC